MTSGKADEELLPARGFGVKLGSAGADRHRHAEGLHRSEDAARGQSRQAKSVAQHPAAMSAHERNIPVIFSTVIYNDHDLKDAGLWGIKMKGSLTLKAGTPASR